MKYNCASSLLNSGAICQDNAMNLGFVIQVGNLEVHVFMEKTDYSSKAFGKTAHCFFWC